MARHIHVLAIATAAILVVSILGLVGCSSSSSGSVSKSAANATVMATSTPALNNKPIQTAKGQAATLTQPQTVAAEKGPSCRQWNMVVVRADSANGNGKLEDADVFVEFKDDTIAISGTYLVDGKRQSTLLGKIKGKYERYEQGMYIYKLDDGSGYAAFGQAPTGSKPYAVVWDDKASGKTITGVVEEFRGGFSNDFVSTWRLTKYRDAQGNHNADKFERATGGKFGVKFTNGKNMFLCFGGKTSFGKYTVSGDVLTATDPDGSKFTCKISSRNIFTKTMTITMGDGTALELTQALPYDLLKP